MPGAKTWLRLGGFGTCALALAAGWVFRSQWIAPLLQQETRDRSDLANVRGRIEGAKKTIADIRAQETAASAAGAELAMLRSELPRGPGAVWLPELVKGHFARFGIGVALVRLNTTRDEPNISGCERDFLSVALPIDDAGRNIPNVIAAVADLDQRNPFVRVLDFAIRADPENPARRVGSLNLAALIQK